MRLSVLLILFVNLHSTLHSQRWHIRPINIQDCNYYDNIFIGKITEYEKNGRMAKIVFSIEENFKSKNNSCEITLKAHGFIPREFDKLCDERWLIFGKKMDQELFFDFDQSTGLSQFQSYSEELIKTDIVYLQNLAATPTNSVKEIYQSSGSGCIPDDEYYVAEGELENGFPNGTWRYYQLNGIRQMEGSYRKGKKWGVWYEYHEDGFVAVKLIYWEGLELKRIHYGDHGELFCFNEECTLWNPHPIISIPFLLPYEKTGFFKGKIQIE